MGVRAFAEVRVGDPVPERRRVVTREDIKTYADASGDQNPLHQDDAFARSVGFDSVIAHGMLTMGHLGAAVVDWLGDPDAILSFSASFREPVLPGEEIVAGGRVRDADPDAKTATLELWVTVDRDGQTLWPVKKAAAVVRLG